MLKAKTIAFFLICVLLCFVTQNWNKWIRGKTLCDILREILVRGQASARAGNGVTVLQGYTKNMARLTANIWKREYGSTHMLWCIPRILFHPLAICSLFISTGRYLYVMSFDIYSSGNAWLLFECVYASSVYTTPWQGISCNHLVLHWVRRHFLFLLFEASLLLIWHADQFFSWENSQTAKYNLTIFRAFMIFRTQSLSVSLPFPNWRVLVLVGKIFHTLIAFIRPLLILFHPFWVEGAELHTMSTGGVPWKYSGTHW